MWEALKAQRRLIPQAVYRRGTHTNCVLTIIIYGVNTQHTAHKIAKAYSKGFIFTKILLPEGFNAFGEQTTHRHLNAYKIIRFTKYYISVASVKPHFRGNIT